MMDLWAGHKPKSDEYHRQILRHLRAELMVAAAVASVFLLGFIIAGLR